MRSLFVATAITLAASAAYPCSPAELLGIAPREGSLGVPTNASLFFAIDDAPGNAVLVDESNEARTDLEVEFASLSRIALPALSPSTSYRVEMDVFEGTPSRTLRFTTGTEADGTAPPLGDIDSDVTVEKIDGGLTFGSGGCDMLPFPIWRDQRIASTATFDINVTADTVVVRLFRTVAGDRVERTAKFTEGTTQVQLEDRNFEVGAAVYQLIAIDAAGNESTREVEATLGQLEEGGCAQTGTSSAGSLLAVLVLLHMRRKRAVR